MDLTFRNAGAWGAGKGSNLEAVEVDNNFWSVAQAIIALQNDPATPNGIASIAVSGTQMTITLHDGTVLGPYTLPVLTFRWRGEWTPATAYAALDVTTVTGTGIFMCQVAHTSGATFDMSQVIGGTLVWYFLFGAVGAPIAPTAVDYLYVGNGDDPDGGIQFGDLTAQRLFANDPAGILIVNHDPTVTLPASPATPAFARFCGANGETVSNSLESWGGNPQMIFRRANGTRAAPTGNVIGDNLGAIIWRGYGATNYTGNIARITAQPIENFTDTAQGTSLFIYTAAVGATSGSFQASIGPGLTVGAPTPPAGGMLIGDINAQRLLVNGVAITGGTGGGLSDAPADGTAYGRKDAAWQRVLAVAGGTVTGAITVGTPGVPAGGLVNGDIDAQRIIISNNAIMPPTVPTSTARFWMVGADGENYQLLLDATATLAAIGFRRANGTNAAPSHVNAGDYLGNFAWRGYGATGYTTAAAARISLAALENFTDTQQGTQYQFFGNLIGTMSGSQFAALGPGLLIGGATPPADYTLGDVVAQRLFAANANGQVWVNRNAGTLPAPAATPAILRLAGADGEGPVASVESWNGNPLFIFRRANGTAAAPAAVAINQNLGAFLWRGYGATAYGVNNARIALFAQENWTDTAQGSQIQFQACPIGSTAPPLQMSIGPSGVAVGTPTAPSGGLQVGDVNAQRVLVNGVAVGAGGSGIFDATADGTMYGRINNAWQRCLALTGGALTGNLTTTGYLSAGVPGAPSGGLIAGDVIGQRLFVNLNPAAAPAPAAATATGLQANGSNGANFDGLLVDSHGGNANIRLRRSNGTGAAPSGVLANDILGLLAWTGYGTTAINTAVGARMQAVATENWSDTVNGARLEIGTRRNAGGAGFVTDLTVGPGLMVGAPAAPGGGMVTGDLNAQRVLINGIPISTSGAFLPTAGGTISGTTPGNLVINRNAAALPPSIGTQALWINFGDTETAPNIIFDNHGATSNLTFRRANGTGAAPTATLAGDVIGAILGRGYGATGYTGAGAAMRFEAAENFTDTNTGGRTVFTAYPTGGASGSMPIQMIVSNGVVIGAAGSPPNGQGSLAINGNPTTQIAPVLTGLNLLVQGVDGQPSNPVLAAIGGNPNLNLIRGNGTAAALTPVTVGQNIGRVGAGGYAGTTALWRFQTGSLQFQAGENWSDTVNGTQLTVNLTPNGAAGIVLAATFGPGLTIGAPTAPAGGNLTGDLNAQRVLVNGVGYVFGFSAPSGVLTASQVLGHHVAQRAITFPANFAGSYAGGTANATASTVVTIATATSGTGTFTTIGTITFAAGSITPTFATTGGTAQTVAAGSVIRASGQTTPDATFANFFCTLAAA